MVARLEIDLANPAGALDGTERIPVKKAGDPRRTTTGEIAAYANSLIETEIVEAVQTALEALTGQLDSWDAIKITDHGAIGDGDFANREINAEALRNAIIEAGETGRPVYIPPAPLGYYINECIETSGIDSLRIFGVGEDVSWFKVHTASFDFSASDAMLSFDTCSRLSLRGFKLYDPTPSSASASPQKDGIWLHACGEANVERVTTRGLGQLWGMHFSACATPVLKRVRSEGNLVGAVFNGACSGADIRYCSFTNNVANELVIFGNPLNAGEPPDVFLFLNNTCDESGTTIALGPNTIVNFRDSNLFSGGSAFALRTRQYSGGGGKIILDRSYVGPWDASGAITAGGIETSDNTTIHAINSIIRSHASGKAIDVSGVTSLTKLIYENTEIIGTRNEGSAEVTEFKAGQYPVVILPDSNSDAASTIEAGVTNVRINAVTTNADDWAVLPAAVPGRKVRGWSVVAHELRTPASSNVKINNVDADGTKEAAIPATTLWEAECVATDAWVLRAWDELGAPITAIVPD